MFMAYRRCRVDWNIVFWKLGCHVATGKQDAEVGGFVLFCFAFVAVFKENGILLAVNEKCVVEVSCQC